MLKTAEKRAMNLPAALRASWFWCSLAALFCTGLFALVSAWAARDIPERPLFFLFLWGTVPTALALLGYRRFRVEMCPKGIGYSAAYGILVGVAQFALFAAFVRSPGDAAVISTLTGLYAMMTVILAVFLLGEPDLAANGGPRPGGDRDCRFVVQAFGGATIHAVPPLDGCGSGSAPGLGDGRGVPEAGRTPHDGGILADLANRRPRPLSAVRVPRGAVVGLPTPEPGLRADERRAFQRGVPGFSLPR